MDGPESRDSPAGRPRPGGARRIGRRLAVASVAACWLGAGAIAVAHPASGPDPARVGARLGTPSAQPHFPIRAAFYYPWFPEAWRQGGISPYTRFHPSAGLYDGSNPATIRRQVRAMTYARIEAGLASWWGRGTRTDARIGILLRVTGAMRTRLRWGLLYEPEGLADPSPARITGDLSYILRRYGRAGSFLRIAGRPVIFVYADSTDGCDMARRWRQANHARAYVALKVFPGFERCRFKPATWYQYAPAVATDAQRGRSFAISPGFHKVGEPVRLRRDLARFRRSIRAMLASRAPWQLVTTFNEWGEGTAVESAVEWQSASGHGAYLDALHHDGRRRRAIPGPR